MIIQSHEKPDILLPDMTFWTMTINQSTTEIYKNYEVLCPAILYAEIYNDISGAKKRLPFEVLCIAPWQILVREELEGRSVTENDNIIPTHLISEQNMDKEEKDVAESIKKIMMNLDEKDKFLSARSPISMGEKNKALAGFAAKAPYPELTWDQFIGRFKEVSKGTIFEVPAHINKHLTTNKNKTRTAIEKALSEYAKMYPINNFKKAFAFSELMLEKDFVGICDRVFIPMLEEHLEFDRTHWNNARNRLTDNHISDRFPYTRYALCHYLAFVFIKWKIIITQGLDQEILNIYTTFISEMFCSFLRTHSTKNTLLERKYLNQDATVHLPTYLLIEIKPPKNTTKL